MEKLENRIEVIVKNSNNYPKAIASEVKDIAIAFATWKENRFVFDYETNDTLFTEFLTLYYKQ